tara:strand:- start:1741 stop:2022 length:282 start_codon:yes stop_codon:yes gene_type:complete
MSYSYNDVNNLIKQQYKDNENNINLPLNSLYYNFFKTDITGILSREVIQNGFMAMLGIKTDKQLKIDRLSLEELESKYPIIYSKDRYKYYGKY